MTNDIPSAYSAIHNTESSIVELDVSESVLMIIAHHLGVNAKVDKLV